MGVLRHDLLQLLRADNVRVENQLVAALDDFRNAGAGRRHAHQRDIHQPLHAFGRAAVAVNQLIQHVLGVGGGLDGGNPLVGLNAPGGVRDIVLRQEGVHGNVHKAVALVGRRGFAAGGGNRLPQHLDIQVIAHGLHMAVLAVAQQAARAAYLQIAHRNAETGPEGGELPDGG